LKRIFKKNDFKVEVYFGTWCSDSQREIPKVIKLLKEAKFDMNALTLIGVGRDKIVPDVSEEERKTLNITNVPTIVIYENGNEINRFVEYAQETLAEDLLMIFSQKPYKHSYQF
jgi:thiol-disulfide isomerase/thioredoxin